MARVQNRKVGWRAIWDVDGISEVLGGLARFK